MTTKQLTRLGAAPWLTPEGMVCDGYTSRYRMESSDLPGFVKSGQFSPLTIHASIVAIRSRLTTGNVVVSACEDTSGANPKLALCVLNDERYTTQGLANLAVQAYTGSLQTMRLARGNWKYAMRFPELVHSGEKARPQACLFLDSDTVIISAHYNDVLSRVYRIDLPTMAVTGQFDFPSPYVHIASAAFRASDSTYWFGDYATSYLLGVDLAASFTAGTAQIIFTNNCSNMTGFGAIEWINISGTDYLLAGEYATSGTRYLYVIPSSALTDTGTFVLANRLKRFSLSTINRNQGIAMHAGKLFVTSNRIPATGTLTGEITRFDILTAIASTSDGATLNYEKLWFAPSPYPEDLSFNPSTGEVWTSTEGYNAVIDFDGWLAYWSSKLEDVNDSYIPENHVTVEYDGAGLVTIKLNNQFFDQVAWEPTVTPAVVSIGGPPTASAGVTNGFFVGKIRNLVIQNQPLSTPQYEDAVNGLATESLTTYTITVSNPGAEAGDTSSWTTEVGGMAVRSASPDPHNGGYYFTGGASEQTIARQRFNLETVTGLTPTEIDDLAAEDDIWARIDWWQTNFNNNDPGGMGIRMLDGTPSQISVAYSGLVNIITGAADGQHAWILRGFPALIPSGARNIDCLIRNDRNSGTNNDAYFDDIVFTVYQKQESS